MDTEVRQIASCFDSLDIIEAMIDGVIIVDEKGCILMVNDICRTIFGYESMKGKNIKDIMFPEDAEKLLMIIDELSNNGKAIRSVNFTGIKSNGVNFQALMNTTMLKNAKGRKIATIGIIREIFVQSIYEEELKRKTEELENAYKDLRNAQHQLIESAKMSAVGQLATGFAHEINNPLTGVLINANLLLKRFKCVNLLENKHLEDFPSFLKLIIESANECKDIVKSLLDFYNSGKINVKEPINLNLVIKRALCIVENNLKFNRITLKTNLRKDLPDIKGNFSRMQQVLVNILINANQFMFGSGEIYIESGLLNESNLVYIIISDTGPGIPEENIKKIFEPFFTTYKIAQGSGSGTGLGLSICHNIINEHGGFIEVENNAYKGATFIIKLPLYKKGD